MLLTFKVNTNQIIAIFYYFLNFKIKTVKNEIFVI